VSTKGGPDSKSLTPGTYPMLNCQITFFVMMAVSAFGCGHQAPTLLGLQG